MRREIVPDMATPEVLGNKQTWQCLHCRGPLSSGEFGLLCRGCGRQYPSPAGIPLLVREPVDYFRAERASLLRTAREARRRSSLLGRVEPYAELPNAVLRRHRDVLDVEAAQAETLLALLEPVGQAPPDALEGDAGELQALRPGWSFDTLVPYLVRDWTGTVELQVAGARIGAALRHAFPDPRGKSVVFAGCGAGGLLAEVPAEFARVLGFDLTLPVLAAARHLLDGKALDLALPRVLNAQGGISLRRRDFGSAPPPVELVAMDALDTAFADCSIDCVVTVFLTDILPDPRALAHEVHRVLREQGVWINYGPSGNNLKAPWHFDQTEAEAFFEAGGFTVVEAEAQRGTNLDVSGACPSVSFRNVVCYLTAARKTREAGPRPTARTPGPDELCATVPQHFPGARLVHRLEASEKRGVFLQHDRIPGRAENWELGGRAARMMVLVDGRRTVGEIADLLTRKQPPQSFDDTLRAFDRFYKQRLLNWWGRSDDLRDRS